MAVAGAWLLVHEPHLASNWLSPMSGSVSVSVSIPARYQSTPVVERSQAASMNGGCCRKKRHDPRPCVNLSTKRSLLDKPSYLHTPRPAQTLPNWKLSQGAP
ncbi:hypothetical protein EB077_11320 [bacterium]|nr:hypothetical protein [bacterium]